MNITLKTLHTATAQEVFDQSAVHLIRQGKQSADATTGQCLYRGPDGLKCAAGCFIADDEYYPEMDEAGTWDAMVEVGIVPGAHMDLIQKLQNAHDNAHAYLKIGPGPYVGIEERLRNIAVEYGLKTDALEAALKEKQQLENT